MNTTQLGIAGIIFIWIMAGICIPAMKRIAPEDKGYPVYALFVCMAESAFILLGVAIFTTRG